MRIDKSNQPASLPHIRKSNEVPSTSNVDEQANRDAKTAKPALPNIRTSNALPVVSNVASGNVGETNLSSKPAINNIDTTTQYLRSLIRTQSESREQFVQDIKIRINNGELATPQAAYETAQSILDE